MLHTLSLAHAYWMSVKCEQNVCVKYARIRLSVGLNRWRKHYSVTLMDGTHILSRIACIQMTNLREYKTDSWRKMSLVRCWTLYNIIVAWYDSYGWENFYKTYIFNMHGLITSYLVSLSSLKTEPDRSVSHHVAHYNHISSCMHQAA